MGWPVCVVGGERVYSVFVYYPFCTLLGLLVQTRSVTLPRLIGCDFIYIGRERGREGWLLLALLFVDTHRYIIGLGAVVVGQALL